MIDSTKTGMIEPRLCIEERSRTLHAALLREGLVREEDTAIIFHNLSFLASRIESLRQSFPSSTLHAIAVKANPLTRILSLIKSHGVGLEVASLPELHMAVRAGFSSDMIVFDSPVKTVSEIRYAHSLGAYINADSFAELERIGQVFGGTSAKERAGIRINPQVGTGTIRSTSVAGADSKFGVPLENNREKLRKYFRDNDWLRGVHVHIGSQGCPVPLLIEGIRKVLDFALTVNEELKEHSPEGRIEVFDIGGGLPVSYHPDEPAVTMQEYGDLLKESARELFSDQFKLITEFGRYVHANAGWAASRVEYVKREKNHNIIMTHLGADLLLRECYDPENWHHQITVVDRHGDLKEGKTNKYIVAGPLCFAGDVIANGVELPAVEEGDYLLIHDIGAYTLSMWSRLNSRQIPKVLGYRNETEFFEILKQREDSDGLFAFWS